MNTLCGHHLKIHETTTKEYVDMYPEDFDIVGMPSIRGKNNPIHRVKDKKSWIENSVNGRKDYLEWKTGKTYEEIYGIEKTKKMKENMSISAKKRKVHGHTGHKHSEETKNKIRMKTLQQRLNNEIDTVSKVQLKLFNRLKKEYSNLVLEHTFQYFSVDMALPNKKIAIEVDGIFWHKHWIAEDKNSLYPVQKRNMKNDLLKQELLLEHNWVIIRIWDIDIDENIEKVVLLIKECVDNGKSHFLG